ncbi:MAG: methyltransferase domain-containing protein [Pseudonocardiaceae bacterium]
MVNSIRQVGALSDPQWIDTFQAIPRHVFLPHLLEHDKVTGEHDSDERRCRWLSHVYQDDSLVTATAHDAALRVDIPTSSSTRPGLMARMLELLDVRDGMRVLEIGTGTGYNAGLLAHRLGDSQVTSIDIDPTLVEHARRALHDLGLSPHLIAGDGAAGVPDRAPFDRIIATCAVAQIPLAWITQLAPGGTLLVNVRGEIAGGTLCLLTKDTSGDDEVIGPFLDIAGHFMWTRADTTRALPYDIHPTSERDQARTTTAPTTVTEIAQDITDPHFRFLTQLHIPGIRILTTSHDTPAIIRAETTDGSWATAHPTGQISQGGTRRLWDSLFAAHGIWSDLGRPEPTRFGIVANPTTQFVYLDHDHNWTRWPLPLLCGSGVPPTPRLVRSPASHRPQTGSPPTD